MGLHKGPFHIITIWPWLNLICWVRKSISTMMLHIVPFILFHTFILFQHYAYFDGLWLYGVLCLMSLWEFSILWELGIICASGGMLKPQYVTSIVEMDLSIKKMKLWNLELNGWDWSKQHRSRNFNTVRLYFYPPSPDWLTRTIQVRFHSCTHCYCKPSPVGNT